MINSNSRVNNGDLNVDNEPVQRTKNIFYLGTIINKTCDHSIEILCRIERAIGAFIRFIKGLMKRRYKFITLYQGIKTVYVFHNLVRCESLDTGAPKKLESFIMLICRRKFRISWKERVRNDEIMVQMRKKKLYDSLKLESCLNLDM